MYELISNQLTVFPIIQKKTTKVQLRFKFTLYTSGTINSDKTANVTSRIYYFSCLINQLDNPNCLIYFYIKKKNPFPVKLPNNPQFAAIPHSTCLFSL